MLKVNSKERISWKEIFEFPLFKDELPKIQTDPKDYEELKNTFLDYVRSNIVKSYLRLNMTEVGFKDSMEPTKTKEIEFISQIHTNISHKRNMAFLYAYMLVLFYKNEQILPEGFNKNMEFEFALAMKAFSKVSAVGTTYFNKDPTEYPPEKWQIFKESASFEELKKILKYDYKILQKVMDYMKREAEVRYKKKLLTKDVVNWFTLIEKKNEGFQEAIKANLKVLKDSSKKGIFGLLSYYMQLTLDQKLTKQLEDNPLFDFGSFYEKY